jgi:hypothetical protein
MDNLSGSSKTWFEEKDKEEIVVEKVVEIPSYKPFSKEILQDSISNARIEYSVTKSKRLGDALVHLEIANKLMI